jgi:DNA invertase Pin-like site-specific DNA recombinase
VRRERGVKLGRPKGPGKSRLDPSRDKIVEMLGYGVPVKRLAEDYGVTEATLHRYLNRRGLRPPSRFVSMPGEMETVKTAPKDQKGGKY